MFFGKNDKHRNGKPRTSLAELALDLLDDPEVQQKLREVVNSRGQCAGAGSAMQDKGRDEPSGQSPELSLQACRSQLRELQGELQARADAYSELNSRYAELASRYEELQRECKAQTDANLNLQQQLESAGQENSRLEAEQEREISQIRAAAEQEISKAQEEAGEIAAKARRDNEEAREREQCLREQFNSALTELQRKKNDLEEAYEELEEQLRQRFPEGWELYRRWENLRPSSRERLDCLCRRPGFMPFICGGAQDDALESIWDEMELCLREGAAEDLKYLRELFRYVMRLVNASKSEDVYAQDDEAAGQPYDLDRHTPDRSSRVQGRVARVLLPGYRNLYLERLDGAGRVRMIRRSIVHVE